MGAYLSRPVFEPDTVCDSGHGMAFGASSVQGWRVSQEDAHNCILDYDKDCSLFAVYDGHGGSEVSKYCSLYLPGFIKGLSSYQAGDCKEALIDAFVKFDQTLTKPAVVEVLEQLALDVSDSDASLGTDEDENAVLAREAKMSLEDLLRSYEAHHKEKDGAKKGEASPNTNNGQPNEEKENKNDANAEAETEAGSAAGAKVAPKSDHANTSETARGEGLPSDENTNGTVPVQGGASSATTATTPEVAVRDSSGGSCSAAGKDDEAGSAASGVGGCSAAGSSSSACSSTGTVSRFRAKQRLVAEQKKALGKYDEDSDDDEDDEEDQDAYGQDDDDDDDDDEGEDSEDDEDEEEPDSEDDDSDDEVAGDEARAGVNEDDDVEMFHSDVPGSGSGSTAVVALIKGDVLTVANAGDSRAVLCRDGKAIDLSVDHKPEDAVERSRIERAGGKVTSDGRVNGGLNLSRAIGDHVYKQNEDLTPAEQMISPLPDVQTIALDRTKDNFLVLACDGIWNCMTSQEVCDFVSACIRNCDNVGQICEQLFRKCIAPDTSGDGTGCDNMTCIIVRLNTEALQDDDKPAIVPQKQATDKEAESTRCNGADGTGSGGKREATDDGGDDAETDKDAASKRQRVAS